VQLEPKHPPRRTRYKLWAYSAEIHRLNAEGYTCDEIRDALAEVGLVVSRSTVQREAARGRQRPAATSATSCAGPMTAAGEVAAPVAMVTSTGLERVPLLATSRALAATHDPRTAKQVAEDFMKDQITNPLLGTERKP
jgi:hypothetical protein